MHDPYISIFPKPVDPRLVDCNSQARKALILGTLKGRGMEFAATLSPGLRGGVPGLPEASAGLLRIWGALKICL